MDLCGWGRGAESVLGVAGGRDARASSTAVPLRLAQMMGQQRIDPRFAASWVRRQCVQLFSPTPIHIITHTVRLEVGVSGRVAQEQCL